MIPKECKRLAEVDFPITAVSKHAVREKSGPKGHISTLHLWWARRPLASSRAVLLALLLPDPCEPLCPKEFRDEARTLLQQIGGCNPGTTDKSLRKALLRFIADFSNWDNAAQRTYLEVSRGLVKAAHGEEVPLVVDPFAGGGSIPLEAIRLGCDAYGSDLNPVACLILKVMLEDIPRQGVRLPEELRRVGAEIQTRAEKKLKDLYPKDPDGATPIAYLWARTVRCESPNCGAEIPIYKSGWLSKKGAKKANYLRESDDGQSVALVADGNSREKQITFRIVRGHGSVEPRHGFIAIEGTKSKGNNADVVCRCCGQVLSGDRKNPLVTRQLSAQRGGADVIFNQKGVRVGGARLLAVVAHKVGGRGKLYRLPVERDYETVRNAQDRLSMIHRDWERRGKPGLCPEPDETLPVAGTLGFRVQRYGVLRWGDLFTARQKVSLETWTQLLAQTAHSSAALGSGLALALSRMAMCGMSLTNWNAFAEKMQHTFGRQAVPMVWDFAEVVPLVHAPGAWKNAYDLVAEVAEAWPGSNAGQVQIADAAEHPLPDQSASVWFTDPPYYNAVPYADLSDFFFVWLKRALPGHPLLRDPFDVSNLLTPKQREAVQDVTKSVNGSPKDRLWFENTMARCFAEGRRVLRDDGIGAVVFAHKTTEGWEALLTGIIRGGLTVTGSWPIATEMSSRLRARDSAALATSVHLICRRRTDDVVGDWSKVLEDLPSRVGLWMERLQGEGVRGADLVFACIGPALEVFSRYSKVETPDGREISLAEFLAKVWEMVGRAALERVLGTAEAKARDGATGSLEEDARLTALCKGSGNDSA